MTGGSSSAGSRESHATLRPAAGDWRSQPARIVDLPNPAGADGLPAGHASVPVLAKPYDPDDLTLALSRLVR